MKANIYSPRRKKSGGKVQKVGMNLDMAGMEKSKLKFNIPLGNKLFFLVHVIFGIGLPVAEHSNRTGLEDITNETLF